MMALITLFLTLAVPIVTVLLIHSPSPLLDSPLPEEYSALFSYFTATAFLPRLFVTIPGGLYEDIKLAIHHLRRLQVRF